MTLTYQATLDEIAEPSIRHFLRSKTASNSKIRTTITGAIWCLIAAVFIFRRSDLPSLASAGLVGAMIGAALNFFTYEATVRKRIRKHLERETEGRLPSTTVFTVGMGNLVCECLGTAISFPLSSLEGVTIDDERLEISFGVTGLCMIPLRVFESTLQRGQFTEMLKECEQAVAPNRSLPPSLNSTSSVRGSED